MKIDKKLVFKGNYLNLRYFWRKEKSLSFEAFRNMKHRMTLLNYWLK